MPLYAFKNDVSMFAFNLMNQLLSLQDFVIITEGAEVDSKTGAGVSENDVADYNFAIRVTATGVEELSRVELEIAADGDGQDLTIEVRDSDFNPDGSAEGTLLKTIVVPKEFLPASAAYWSIPLDLTGLTLGQNAWVIVRKVGDATDHFHLVGEADTDVDHPGYYRSGDSGAWTENDSIHFKAYSDDTGDPVHCLVPEATLTTEYDGDIPSKIYLYIPPPDTAVGGVRDIMDLTMSGDMPKRGVVS